MILDELAAATRERIAKDKEKVSPKELLGKVDALMEKTLDSETFAFEKALRQPGLSVISEVKKASPSKGVIAGDFPYMEIAKEYEASGADAISCLTEPGRFLGNDRYLREIAKEVGIPVLRKDFTVDPYMIYQAKEMGASAVLLIAAILSDAELKEFFHTADGLGLSCLFEAHDEREVDRCLLAGARVLGVNNRNLKDFSVDVRNSVRLREMVPKEVCFVSESGIKKPEDVKILKENGTDAVLIGEMLMRSDKKGELIKNLKEI